MRIYIYFFFLHASSSQPANWADVMIGISGRNCSLLNMQELATMLCLRVVGNDKLDEKNRALSIEHGIENLATALKIETKVRTALNSNPCRSVLFVSSPDHLPRIVRDVRAGAYGT